MTIVPWAPLYRAEILAASRTHEIDPKRLLALIWQESYGGMDGSGIWAPQRLYRYEPGFWNRYLRGRTEWAPPSGSGQATTEAHKRRVSASYGVCQIMFPTAVMFGLPRTSPPEVLFDPGVNLDLAGKILRHWRDKGLSWTRTWLRYNGGGRLEYAAEIEKKFQQVVASSGGGGSW